MQQRNKIGKTIISFEDESGFQCVDIIMINSSSFTFKLFRRDPEDPRGWFPTSTFGDQYTSKQEAISEAINEVDWLNPKIK